MIAAYFTLAGLAIYTLQIAAEWLANHRREAVKAYDSFKRTENVYPKYTL